MQTNPARSHPWMPLSLLMLVIPLAFMFVYFALATNSFQMLGLTSTTASLLLLASVLGSMVNIPLARKQIVLADPRLAGLPPAMQRMLIIFHYYPPAVETEVIAINVGGALIPIGFSVYLFTLPTTAITTALLATATVAVLAKLLARPVPGLGITLPGFVPPLLAAGVALGLIRLLNFPGPAAPVAYICGSLGTLIGADLLNLPLVLKGGLLAASPARLWTRNAGDASPTVPPRILSIGGAGVFDGVFLTGAIAPLLVALHL
jgi:uncharacterized membrane protein